DRVLADVARTLEAHLPDGASVARIGGEEFAVLLPGASAEQAAGVAEILRAAVAAVPFDGPGQVTISIGAAGFAVTPVEDVHILMSALMGAADAALYAAKRGGRNRVVHHLCDLGAMPRPAGPPA